MAPAGGGTRASRRIVRPHDPAPSTRREKGSTVSDTEFAGRSAKVSRRGALVVGGGAAGGLLMGALPVGGALASERHVEAQRGTLPSEQMQKILQAEGTVTNGVLSIDLSRDDIGDVRGPRGVTFTPAFEVDGTLTFQPLKGGRAIFNGDLAVKGSETNAVIDAIIRNGLVFQAFHQHYDQMSPQIWFIHWRGIGHALHLARAVRNVLAATSIPLPQTMPKNPTTPLDADRLGAILGGDATVGEEGVVSVEVSRRGGICLDGIRVSPELNISTMVEIRPLDSDGTTAAAAPDFSMTSHEVQPVVAVMRKQGWHVGCLYNQETDEHPQLYFAHMLKTGDPYRLAHEIRRGLDRTRAG
jgi:hypothetical protein